MGNSSSNIGGLKIELENYIVNSGEKVRGKIHLYIRKDLPSCQLDLKFIGTEFTRWRVQKGKTTQYYSGSRLITKINHVLHSWPEGLNPSCITVPFKFRIPQKVPGSFRTASGLSAAIIEYSLELSIKNEKKTILKDEQCIFVTTNENYGIIDTVPLSLNLVSCCCFKKKQIQMGIKWINSTFSHGENIECILEVDNSQGLCNIKYITVKIFCGISIFDNSGYGSSIRESLMNADYHIGIKKGEVLNEKNGGRFCFDLNKSPYPWNPFDLNTCKTALISADFYVKFELTTDAFWLTEDRPEILSKFYVNPNRHFYCPPSIEAVNIPVDWNPVLYQAV